MLPMTRSSENAPEASAEPTSVFAEAKRHDDEISSKSDPGCVVELPKQTPVSKLLIGSSDETAQEHKNEKIELSDGVADEVMVSDSPPCFVRVSNCY